MTDQQNLTLRDVDNRGDDGPFETNGTPEQIIGYIDGPLRRDLTDLEASRAALDASIEHVRSGQIAEANALLNPMSVYISVPESGAAA